MRFYNGQGTTEYLVLLAVVLIVALVSVALLGFFPGMASDAKITQSQMYWSSASPIAITEWAAKTWVNNYTFPYIRFKNTGMYPIRITALIGGDGGKATRFSSGNTCGAVGNVNMTDILFLAPGEEKYFGPSSLYGTQCNWQIYNTGGGSWADVIGGASSICKNSTSSPGILQFNSFGFEYIEYIDGQQITKRQIGKELIIKCLPPI